MNEHKEAWEFEPADRKPVHIPLRIWLWGCGAIIVLISCLRWLQS